MLSSIRCVWRSSCLAVLVIGVALFANAWLAQAAGAAPANVTVRPQPPLEFPATPAGTMAAEYLKAFNAGEEAMRAFLTAHVSAEQQAKRSIEERLGRFRDMKRDLTTLTPARIQSTTPTEVTFLAQSYPGDWLTVTVGCQPDAPQYLAGVRLEAGEVPAPMPGAAAPAAPTGPPLSVGALRDSIDRLVDARLADGSFSGRVMLASDDRTVYERSAGLAHRAPDAPVQADTRFNLGSINKVFTMVAIAQLAQQGRLHVSDSVGALLPDNPVPAARGVTIDQLIHHRSGLGDIFGDRYDKADHARLRDLKDFLPLFADQPLEFAPGTRQRYSNAGFVLLGLIIERVSGQEYHDYIRDHIYRPAGMTRTDSYELERRTPDLATGYTRRLDDDGRRNGDHSKPAEGPLRENTPTLPARASSAGGGYSTTDDLLRFSKAMRDHQLVDAGWTDWVMGGQVPAAATVASNHAHGAWGIAGGAPGTNSVVEMDFEHGVVLVVLANMDPPIAELMSRTIRQWIARTDFGTGASRVSK